MIFGVIRPRLWQYTGAHLAEAKSFYISPAVSYGPTYLELPLRQWGASNVYLLVLSSWKLYIAENPIAVMGL